MKLRSLLVWSCSSLPLLVACGGGKVPAISADRESGQSSLMGQTVAGKCDARNHTRPFVIEWDATDSSSFEALAGSDIAVVKYEGCDLQVLEACSSELKGSIGAYAPIIWTAGSVEKVDISNEGELFAKLPLGAASLGGRVNGGEKFHMEYYVSGTRKATRDAIYRADLDKIGSCQGATHFVQGYNLGAFALGSQKELGVQAGATAWGIGVGGNSKSLKSAEKKGGVITSCTGDSAQEVASCKVPVRLTLRGITEGSDPAIAAAVAPDTSASLNLAGQVGSQVAADDQATVHYNAALVKNKAGDGKGCLKELDEYDRHTRIASQRSTEPAAYFSQVRAQCVMLSGQCDAGKAQLRKAIATQQADTYGEAGVDMVVDAIAPKFCRGKMSPRDQLLVAAETLSSGIHTKKLKPAECTQSHDTLLKLAAELPVNPADNALSMAQNPLVQQGSFVACLANAGDCGAAYTGFRNGKTDTYSGAQIRDSFDRSYPVCKGK